MGDISFPATSFSQPIQSNIIIKNITEDIDNFQFIFRDENKDEIFNDSDAVFIVFGDSAGKEATSFSNLRVSWSMTLQSDTALPPSEHIAPQPGDIYKIITNKPVRNGEFFEFTTRAQKIDKKNAKFIGMIPDILDNKIYQIGNAAGMGAQHCLININLRKKSQELLKKIEYVEIAVQKNFQREYAEAMYLIC